MKLLRYPLLFFPLWLPLITAAAEPGIAAPPVTTVARSTEQKDVVYGRASGEDLKLDLAIPEGTGPFPACILVHGGGWIGGAKNRSVAPLFEPLHRAGYAWFSIDYRLAPKHRYPAAVEDVETAIRWVKAHAKDYDIDPQRIALIGDSAGGHLVSLIGTRDQAGDLGVAAVVPFFAPHNLLFGQEPAKIPAQLAAFFNLTELTPENKKILHDASSTTYIKPGLPPFLLLQGTKDQLVDPQQSVVFQQQMRAAGNSCDLILVEGGPHGMVRWGPLGSDYRERLVTWLNRIMKKSQTPSLNPSSLHQ